MHVVIFPRPYSVQQLLDQSIPFFRFFVVRAIRIVRYQFEHIFETQNFRNIINQIDGIAFETIVSFVNHAVDLLSANSNEINITAMERVVLKTYFHRRNGIPNLDATINVRFCSDCDICV